MRRGVAVERSGVESRRGPVADLSRSLGGGAFGSARRQDADEGIHGGLAVARGGGNFR